MLEGLLTIQKWTTISNRMYSYSHREERLMRRGDLFVPLSRQNTSRISGLANCFTTPLSPFHGLRGIRPSWPKFAMTMFMSGHFWPEAECWRTYIECPLARINVIISRLTLSARSNRNVYRISPHSTHCNAPRWCSDTFHPHAT